MFKLQTAMTEEEEYLTRRSSAWWSGSRAAPLCFVDPGSTKFPDTCLQAYEDAGIRVILGECVTDQESSLSLPRYATPALSNTIFDTVPSIALSRFVLVPG